MRALFFDGTPEAEALLARLDARGADDVGAVLPRAAEIVRAVRQEGDPALLRFAEELDGRRPEPLFSRSFDGEGALRRLPEDIREALSLAASRIHAFHARQRDEGFRFDDALGVRLGQRVRPMRRAGIYAPGGKARYPSSVLMGAIPAKVAGVPDIILATPNPNDLLLAAAHLAGVSAVLDAGGAQAIAALAYGTDTVPRVDKIVGPGNLYVTAAKRLVFGDVDIDGIAGPSEILVLADRSADPRLVAADLLSQAEHDEAAYPLLLSTDEALARAAVAEVFTQLEGLPRARIARASVDAHGAAVVVTSRERLAELADRLAAEHVAIHMEDPDTIFDAVPAMGAAFVGAHTPEAAGDYLAGPSHVLPTGGAVRFGSPLGVYDFYARTSYIRYEARALGEHEAAIVALARAEGLEAHARAVLLRTRGT